ncbi:hypothetical protein [Streptomyces albireticuli]|uniref:hypothetical protein n=1 Tax=Streptomyces albireticuli TaxID=1940 RepID=UPI0036A8BECF
MSAHEPAAEPVAAAADENRRPEELSGERLPAMSMRDLLAACAAADAVSTPPRAPEAREGSEGERDAA